MHRTKDRNLSYVATKVLPIVPDYKYDNTRLELVAGITNNIAKKIKTTPVLLV